MEIKNRIKQKITSMVRLCTIFYLILSILSIFSGYGFCSEKTYDKVKHYVNKSIDLRQKTQKKLDKWEHDKTQLIAEYERLKQGKEILDQQNKVLINEKLKHQNRLRLLVLQKQENLKIQKEMLPFLQNVVAELSQLIAEGLPFLLKERKKRIAGLKEIMDDPDTGIAEKYRKTMEGPIVLHKKKDKRTINKIVYAYMQTCETEKALKWINKGLALYKLDKDLLKKKATLSESL